MFFLTPLSVDLMKSIEDLEYPLTKLLVFTEHQNPIRRGGVASTLKSVTIGHGSWCALTSNPP